MRSPRISEGKCAVYGREPQDVLAVMSTWRARLHNEKAGFARTDLSGANASISLIWTGSNEAQQSQRYGLASYRKQSARKQTFDLGVGNIGRGNQRVDQQEALSAMAPAALSSARLGMGDAIDNHHRQQPAPRSFLDGEPRRLQMSAQCRELGQSFLRAGNLAQAKFYLDRAEKLLQVSPTYLQDGAKAEEVVDESRSTQT